MDSALDRLMGIPYKYPEWDCLGLANYVRSLYNAPPLPDFSWMYREYTEATMPDWIVRDLMEVHGNKREGLPQHMDHICLQWRSLMALGTVIEDGGQLYGVYMWKTSQVVALERLSDRIESVWTLCHY